MSEAGLRGRRVAVTGGAGFIGSELVRQLCEAGAIVTVIDNLANGKRANLAGLPGDRVRLHVADVRDADALRPLLDGCEIVYHLACLGVRHSIACPAENHEVNAGGTLTVLRVAHQARAERFVYVSTSEVYGTARRAPMDESHPTFPLTVYGGSKLAGESYARAYHACYGFPTVMVRPFNAFGPRSHHEGDSGEVIPKFLLRTLAGLPMVIFGDGTQTRDFSFVSDTAAGILAAGTAERAIGQTLNIGSGREIEIRLLAGEIGRIAGSGGAVVHDEPRPGDVLRLCADTALASDLLGYAPTVALADGLERLMSWYRAQGVAPAELLREERVRNWERTETQSREALSASR
jgi:UDP-glucose 4-epimerase